MQHPVDPIFDYQFRLILIGDSTVGKSSLLKYFTDGKFADMCDPTVGVDFFARLIDVKSGVRVKLQLWDTAGQERFRYIYDYDRGVCRIFQGGGAALIFLGFYIYRHVASRKAASLC